MARTPFSEKVPWPDVVDGFFAHACGGRTSAAVASSEANSVSGAANPQEHEPAPMRVVGGRRDRMGRPVRVDPNRSRLWGPSHSYDTSCSEDGTDFKSSTRCQTPGSMSSSSEVKRRQASPCSESGSALNGPRNKTPLPPSSLPLSSRHSSRVEGESPPPGKESESGVGGSGGSFSEKTNPQASGNSGGSHALDAETRDSPATSPSSSNATPSPQSPPSDSDETPQLYSYRGGGAGGGPNTPFERFWDHAGTLFATKAKRDRTSGGGDIGEAGRGGEPSPVERNHSDAGCNVDALAELVRDTLRCKPRDLDREFSSSNDRERKQRQKGNHLGIAPLNPPGGGDATDTATATTGTASQSKARAHQRRQQQQQAASNNGNSNSDRTTQEAATPPSHSIDSDANPNKTTAAAGGSSSDAEPPTSAEDPKGGETPVDRRKRRRKEREKRRMAAWGDGDDAPGHEEIEVTPNHQVQIHLPPTDHPTSNDGNKGTQGGDKGKKAGGGGKGTRPAPLVTLEVKTGDAAELDRTISELTMRSSYGGGENSLIKIPDNRRMAYYAVGKHHRQSGRGGNRRCYFSGKLILGGAPFYAGAVQQGLRTLVVFCLPSALGLPNKDLKFMKMGGGGGGNNSHVGGASHHRSRVSSNSGNSRGSGAILSASTPPRPKSGGSSKSSHNSGTHTHSSPRVASSLLSRSRARQQQQQLGGGQPGGAGGSVASKSFSRLSSLDDISLSIDGDLDPNWGLDRDYLIKVLPQASAELLQQIAAFYPEQFETLPVQVRHPSRWKLYVKFCFFSGLPIAEGEMHYKLLDEIAEQVYGEEIVLSHEVMEAVNGDSAEILTLPNQKTFRYLKRHYAQQCCKLDDRVFRRASWERLAPEV